MGGGTLHNDRKKMENKAGGLEEKYYAISQLSFPAPLKTAEAVELETNS